MASCAATAPITMALIEVRWFKGEREGGGNKSLFIYHGGEVALRTYTKSSEEISFLFAETIVGNVFCYAVHFHDIYG